MRNLRDAFGPVPESFHTFVEETLTNITQEKPARRAFRLRPVIVILAAILLLAGTALAIAHRFGVLDFQRRYETHPLPEATDMVVDLSDIPAVQSERIRYQVRDALLDEGVFLLTLELTPVEPDKTIILNFDTPPFFPPDDGETETDYLTLARESGKALIRFDPPDIAINGNSGGGMSGSHMLEDGKVISYIERYDVFAEPGSMLDVECTFHEAEIFDVLITPLDEHGGFTHENITGNPSSVSMRFSMVAGASITETLRFDGPIDCEMMTVDSVSFTRTPLATYMKLRYTLRDDLTAADWPTLEMMSFEWVKHPDDETYMQHSGWSCTIAALPDPDSDSPAGLAYDEESVWPALRAFPDVFYIRPVYGNGEAFGKALTLKTEEATHE